MLESSKISVIVPVYNVEKYLKRCLNSLVNQTYTNIEIICVNDGSKDNSLNILNEYAQKDNRIVVISQENQGQGIARNKGLEIAKGDYIGFIDPDDFIDVAIETGGIVLIKNSLKDIVKALSIAKKTFARIKLNLFWVSLIKSQPS